MDYMLRDLKMTGIENRYDVLNELCFVLWNIVLL